VALASLVPNFAMGREGDRLARIQRKGVCSFEAYPILRSLWRTNQTAARSIRDYQAQFESLLSKIGNLSQSQLVSCFVSGLKEEMKVDGTTRRPVTLTSAIVLARVYEARNMAL
jgi:hypothetical protein